MMRKSALVVGILFSSLTAGRLLAQQDSANAKHANPASSMNHAPAATPMHHDSTRVSSAGTNSAQHARWTKEQIKEAQEGLAKAGYFKGQPNGVYGKSTRKAVRDYQKANKLPVTGHLNQDLLTRLHSA
jgi:peptidoglycan hydrolase-like protein with peptidoglycan-binding domain